MNEKFWTDSILSLVYFGIIIVFIVKWINELTIGQFIAVSVGLISLYFLLRYLVFKK